MITFIGVMAVHAKPESKGNACICIKALHIPAVMVSTSGSDNEIEPVLMPAVAIGMPCLLYTSDAADE